MRFHTLLVIAALASLSLVACGADDSGSSSSGTGATATAAGIPTGVTSTVDTSQADDDFFARYTEARKSRGDSPETTACLVTELRKVATREELDEVEAGGSSFSLAQKAHKALQGCKAPAA
jgi:hypothetical protein